MHHALLLSPDDQAVSAITGVLEEMSVTCERPLDGLTAAHKLTSQNFDLVLVDCENLTAAKLILDVCRRGEDGNNPVPIAIVDGRAGLPTAFRLGAELILTKPVARDQARSTIRTAVSRVRRDAPPASEVADPAADLSSVEAAATASLIPSQNAATDMTGGAAANASAPSSQGNWNMAQAAGKPPQPPLSTYTPERAPATSLEQAPTPSNDARPAIESETNLGIMGKDASRRDAANRGLGAAGRITLDEVQPAPLVAPKAPASAIQTGLSPLTSPSPSSIRGQTTTGQSSAAAIRINPQPDATEASPAELRRAAEAARPASLWNAAAATTPGSNLSEVQPGDSEAVPGKPMPAPAKAAAFSEPPLFSAYQDRPKKSNSKDPKGSQKEESFVASGTDESRYQEASAGEAAHKTSGSLLVLLLLVVLTAGVYAAWSFVPSFRAVAEPQLDRILAIAHPWLPKQLSMALPSLNPSPRPVPVPVQSAPLVKPQSPAPVGQAVPAPATNAMSNPIPPLAAPADVLAPANHAPLPPKQNPASSIAPTAIQSQPAQASNSTSIAAKNVPDGAINTSAPKTLAAAVSDGPALPGEKDAVILSSKGAEKRLDHRVPPKFPVAALSAPVVLKEVVDETGKVAAVRVVEGDAASANAAVLAVKQWAYKPYLRNGTPLPFTTLVIFEARPDGKRP